MDKDQSQETNSTGGREGVVKYFSPAPMITTSTFRTDIDPIPKILSSAGLIVDSKLPSEEIGFAGTARCLP